TADEYIVRMVLGKAQKAAKACDGRALIITADTIGVLDSGEVLVKPVDKADAFAMWDKLSGRAHKIWTAVAISFVQSRQIMAQKHIKVATTVHFTTLSEAQKERYWATGEPLDKAGAYAIQGGAMAWVRSIEGSYTNVVGLPLVEVLALIDEFAKAHDFPRLQIA
ncbi:Maf family protein, partial [Moraxella caviae]